MSVDVVPFAEQHAEGVAAVCREPGWPTYADPSVARSGCAAPGVIASVAVEDETVVGFAQGCGDGVMQSYLSQQAMAGYRIYPGRP